MHLVVIGVSHNTAPIELRERLALGDASLAGALAELRESPRIAEACIVSTCNRTEVYALTLSRAEDDLLVGFLAGLAGVEHSRLEPCLYRHPGHHAVKHLFEVACGLDSMALGETQVLGQIKDAYCAADGVECTGVVLNGLFQRAIAVGKRARTETGISCGAFSIGAAAVEFARSALGELGGKKVLLVGAGKMGKLSATHLAANGAGKVFVVGRSGPRAARLACLLGGEPVGFDRIGEILAEVDVVVSSTSSRQPVITRELMETVMSARDGHSILVMDIAVPRDVEPSVGEMAGVLLHNIDDLRSLVEKCSAERAGEAEKVRQIVEEETAAFMGYLRSLEAVPMIRRLREKFESVYQSEWERCAPKLAHLSETDRELVRKAIKSAVTKLTHDPIIRMKDYAANGKRDGLEVAREIFELGPDE